MHCQYCNRVRATLGIACAGCRRRLANDTPAEYRGSRQEAHNNGKPYRTVAAPTGTKVKGKK